MYGEKYRVLRSLNTAGTVTLAESTADGRRYVLKELTEESTSIYRRISELPPQENLMQVHEILRQDGHNVAVCDFAEGKPLDELLESGRVFPIDELCSIISQLCRAAEHLHHNGIIHRDINPKNIILDENLHLTLIDYGISRLFTGNREQDTTLYGTEGFAPPEQYGFRETRFTADIYAIGVVLKLLLNVCSNCPPAQEVFLRNIAAKCTRFVPEKRFRNAAAIRRAINCSRCVFPVGIAAACTVACAGVIAAVLMLNITDADVPKNAVETSVSTMAQIITTPVETSASTTAQTTTIPVETSALTTAQTTTIPVETSTSTTAQTTTIPVETSTSTTAQTTTIPVETSTSTTVHTVTTPAVTTASTTAQTVTNIVTEVTQPQELHTSDMDNPNKITVTTEINERGYYEDIFEYQFYDDPMVHGEWCWLTSISTDLLTPQLTADLIKDNIFLGDNIFSTLSFGDNGEAQCILYDGTETPCGVRWTNGFLICEYVEGTAAQQLFALTLDGEEFLFVAVKTGDFSRENKVLFYEVYTRAE